MHREWPSRLVPGALWQRSVAGPAEAARVLPDGCMDIIWTGEQLLVAGPDRTGWISEPLPGPVVVGLRFRPGVAPAVLGVPASELLDRRVTLDAIWRPAVVRRLTEEVALAEVPTTVLERVAAERLGPRSPVDPLLPVVVERLSAGVSISAIAAWTGVGERQLHRRSASWFGYGPKLLARILRMGRALDLARAGSPLATAALDAGYADQAHLARDLRQLTGVSARRLLS